MALEHLQLVREDPAAVAVGADEMSALLTSALDGRELGAQGGLYRRDAAGPVCALRFSEEQLKSKTP